MHLVRNSNNKSQMLHRDLIQNKESNHQIHLLMILITGKKQN